MKIVIIGNSGSGKTWLAKKLATNTTEIIHLDDLFWLPGGFDRKRSKEEVRCWVPDDSISRKSFPLFLARDMLFDILCGEI